MDQQAWLPTSYSFISHIKDHLEGFVLSTFWGILILQYLFSDAAIKDTNFVLYICRAFKMIFHKLRWNNLVSIVVMLCYRYRLCRKFSCVIVPQHYWNELSKVRFENFSNTNSTYWIRKVLCHYSCSLLFKLAEMSLKRK